MTPKEAYQFIKRQLKSGRAIKDGISTRYACIMQASYNTWLKAIETIDGEAWKEYDFYPTYIYKGRKHRMSNRIHHCWVGFVPDEINKNIDIVI